MSALREFSVIPQAAATSYVLAVEPSGMQKRYVVSDENGVVVLSPNIEKARPFDVWNDANDAARELWPRLRWLFNVDRVRVHVELR